MEGRTAKRKPNWTDTEQFIMLDAYAKFKDTLAYHATSSREKSNCWSDITKQLNQFNSTVERSIDEVKRKWHNLLGQARRDFYDWKQTCQNPNLHPSPVPMPAISHRVLELHGGFKLENWKESGSSQMASQQEEEFIYVEASSSDVLSETQDECQDSPGIAEPEIEDLAPDCVKQECPSPEVYIQNESGKASAYKTAVAPSSMHQIPTVFHCGTATNLRTSTPPNPASLTFHAAKSNHTNDMETRIHVDNVSPLLTQTSQKPNPCHIPAPTHVSMPTISNISSSVDQMKVLQQPSLLGPSTNPQPSEPPRKKVRASETGMSERGAGLHAEREAELRFDILQLEKDKLWLETEKLRLEIDILRRKKQQMNANY